RRAPDPLAEQAGRLADWPTPHDGVLGRTSPPACVSAQRNSNHPAARHEAPSVLRLQQADRLAADQPRAELHPHRRRLRSHGATGTARRVCCRCAGTAPPGMTAVTDADIELVRALVAMIPAGKVATYGDIASAAGLSSPRIVGWIMRTDSADLPWHRVIRSSGRPAFHLATRQLELLRAEGVLAVDGKVPLRDVRHSF